MRIESISYKIPSLEISNDQVLEFIEHYNPDLPNKSLEYVKRVVKKVLLKNGCKTRYIRDKRKEESAVGLTVSALNQALEEAQTDKNEIDLLIYCGVGRGFLEPANSYFIADYAGLNCACFDILDACMSWVRALEIASVYLKQKKYRKIAVVNAEFNVYERGFPELYRIENLNKLKYSLSGYTIGEAATATILSDDDSTWTFNYDSHPEYAGICNIPLKGYESFMEKRSNFYISETDIFSAHGMRMMEVGKIHMVPLIKNSVKNIKTVDACFPHLASLKTTREIADEAGIERSRLFTSGFIKYGNIVSATIPVSIKMAIEEKKLNRGDRVILCPGSAGMSFAVIEFKF